MHTILDAIRNYASVLLLTFLFMQQASSETLRVAVAANFKTTMEALAKDFEQRYGHTLLIASSSTGKHYAQIINGAPYDLFFAADVRRPALLEEQKKIVPGTRFTYAIGKLILWSPEPDYVDPEGKILKSGDYRRLAIANPRLAPYGLAAKQVLQKMNLYNDLSTRLVRGENIAQTYQYVATGNARLGFVALSQLQQPGKTIGGSYWAVPGSLYDPIRQQAVQLRAQPVAEQFLDYVKSDAARRIIQAYGYAISDETSP